MKLVPGDPFVPHQRDCSAVKAIENFTDREEALSAFARHVDAPRDHVLPVLHFYGVGGIGKTSLVHKLSSSLSREAAPIPHALLDLSEARDRDPVRALTILRVALGEFGVPFDRFDLVSGVLAAAEGAGEGQLFRLSPWAQAAVELAQALPVVGSPLAAGKAAVERVLPGLLQKHPAVREWLERVGGSDELQRLRRLPREDMLYELVSALAADLAEGLPDRPGCACRAVIFIDTYEALWTNLAGPTSPQGRGVDEWVRELFAHLHGANAVLLVVAGRDLLCWPQVDDRWRQVRDRGDLSGFLDAHLIGGLSATDTQRYLAVSGVGHASEAGAPTRLQAAIIDCASAGLENEGCHPLFLGMCVDIVRNERGPYGRGTDPEPGLFAGIPSDEVARKLAERFLTSLSGGEMPELVRDLSVARWFDRRMVESRLGNVPRARAAFDRLAQFSFTTSRQDGGLTFHALMREALHYLIEHDDPQCVTDLHCWYREHWQTRYAADVEDDDAAEVEAWYHQLHLEPQGAVEAWTSAALAAEEALDGARARALLTWWDDLDLSGEQWRTRIGEEACADDGEWMTSLARIGLDVNDEMLRKDVGDMAWVNLLRSLASGLLRLYPLSLNHGPVLLWAIRCLRTALRVTSEQDLPEDWAMIQTNLGTAYKALPTGDRGQNLARAIACYQAALRVTSEQQLPEDWAMIQNNLGNSYADLPTGDRGENLARATACYLAALRVYTEEAFPTRWAGIHRNLGLVYARLPSDRGLNVARAIACYEAALRFWTLEDFPRDWSYTQNDLGHAYSELPSGDRGQNLARAIAFYDSALRVQTEEALPADWAITQNNLGDAYSELPTGDRAENLARAMAFYESALRVQTEEAFPEEWAWTRYRLARVHALAGHAEESLAGLRSVIQANRDKYAPMAREDVDLAGLREDPRFQRLLDGQASEAD